VRALSIAFVAAIFYQSSIPLFPWYIPPAAFLAALTLGGLGDALAERWPKTRLFLVPAGMAVVAWALLLLAGSAWQLHWQQRLVEGQRRRIGEWLRDNRDSASDTVFLEPLGYIGYFSQLRMLDYPGLSSNEVVATRRKLGDDWAGLIGALKPHWVVLRHHIPLSSTPGATDRFLADYALVRSFDVEPQVKAIAFLPGRDYLMFDAWFDIYRRRT
jgi:hypothetical protein